MCTIPKRCDKPHLNSKIAKVNKHIHELSRIHGFHVLTHEFNELDYKDDGLHFNMRGTAKFAFEIRHLIRNLMSISHE